MFWAASADCLPLLPVSGLAIVARAEWMGSEPEMMLKTLSVSNKGLECIHCGPNKHLQKICTNIFAGTQPHRQAMEISHSQNEIKYYINPSMCAHTHRKTNRLLFLIPTPPSALFFPLSPEKWQAGRQQGWTHTPSEWSAVKGLAGRESVTTGQFSAVLCHYWKTLHTQNGAASQAAVDLITPRALCGCGTF